MKRVAPLSHGVMVPRVPVVSGAMRTLTTSTTLTTDVGTQITSACLGCPDQRCSRFTEVELGRETRVESPYAPDPAVCPTYAITRDSDGIMTVAADDCLGCGLCVARCPVGAIHLDSDTAVAQVEYPADEHYERMILTADEFEARRAALTEVMVAEMAPFVDAGPLIQQISRAATIVAGPNGQRVLRLLTRNAFLLGGAAARLKNVGDNNCAAELLVDTGDDLLVIEVEPSTDVPDAVRRVLAGCAIVVSRLGADRKHVSAAVVVPRLPNLRVEYYRVVRDVYERLGLSTYGIPLALLLLAIRAGGGDLSLMLRHLCGADGTLDTEAVVAIFGDPGDLAALGLVPLK